MAVPEIKIAPYVPHEDYATKEYQIFHKPFPPPPIDSEATPQSLPRIQTQNLSNAMPPAPQSLQVPAPAYHAHLSPHGHHQYSNGMTASPISSAKSTYLSVSPVEPLRERTSMQCFTTPVVSRFSQGSYELQRPPLVAAVRLFIIRWIIEWWLIEIVSWIFGTACIAIVAGVLLMYNDNEIPQWPLGITLGAFLAVFSACAKAGLLLPTAECLGQLKWNWFKDQPKSLIDFEILDAASRGPWGSILLMIRSLRDKGLSLASVGGAVIILCLPLDLFFQQGVGTPRVWIAQPMNALIPRATSYIPPDSEFWVNGTGPVITPDMALQQIAPPYMYSNGSIPDLEVNCPTSNCTWEPFETLGLCNSCKSDIITELEYGCYNATADWLTDVSDYASVPPTYPSTFQCGWFLNASSEDRVLMSGYAYDPTSGKQGEVLETRLFPLVDANVKSTYWDGSVHFKDRVNPVTDVIIVHTSGGPEAVYRNEKPLAQECVISWCTQTVSSSSFEGRISENITSTWINDTQAPFAWDVRLSDFYYDYTYDVIMNPPDQHRRLTTTPTTSNQDVTFTVSRNVSLNFQFMIDMLFPSFVTIKPDEPDINTKFYTLNSFKPGGAKIKKGDETPWRSHDIVDHMDNLAKAMTRVIRDYPNQDDELDYIEGTAWQLKIQVRVRWEWFILPLALSAISLIFLVITVAKSSRDIDDVGIWKNSALAILFNGLGDDVQRSVGPNARMGEIRNKAMDLSVKIVPE